MSLNQLMTETERPSQVGPVPLAVLESMAEHCRASTWCLLMLQPDGSILFHDAGAGLFFDRYVVPALRQPEIAARELRAHVRQLNTHVPAQIWNFVPGAILCAIPHVERRQIQGVLVIAARSDAFQQGEDVLRACSQLGLDAAWLQQQADRVTAYGPERLAMGANLMLALLRDRIRVSFLEGELNSLSSQLANAYEELSLIDQINSGMRVNRSSSEFFRQACLDVTQVINVRGMGVALRSDRSRQGPALYGELSLTEAQLQRLAEQLLATLRDRKSCVLVNNVAGDRAFQWLAESAQRLIAVPLQRGEQLLGCLFGLDKVSGEFDSVDSKLLTSIANESAIFLENSMLYGDVHDLMMGLLHSLTSAVDAKDAYTCGHSERVALLSRHLASKIGLSDGEVERIYMAGLLHDVGKIGVPESVLQKTGRLTAEEFDAMKKHPGIGARILADVKQLEDIIPGVLHHHERYDGRGYPAGLAGQDIPLMGRLICLADCFDAMTSNRTYRKALPLEVALTEIRRCSGTQFDPKLAEVFLQITTDHFRVLLRDHQQQAKKLLELQETLRAS